MMNLSKAMGIVLIGMMFLPSCKKDTLMPDQTFSFDFETSSEGWEAGFADYPDGEEVFYELSSSHDTIPSAAVSDHKGLKIVGNNHSDDLFMFFKKQVTGLVPLTTYKVQFDLEMASQYPENSVGVGGSPGASVYIKVGATDIEPNAEISNGEKLMNIDKGNQATEGQDMINLGTVGIDGDEFVYKIIERDNLNNEFQVTTDADGKVWLIVGTDSGFEGLSVLYYDKIEARFTAVD
ncbi:MAG: hypothetical protein KDE26_14595 [Bacteroidetes bacterium]|nr:hypothetical protein [Bacteroidota bacterium]MCB0844480.1 hypothetical protein [Bacteroidota bacterium]